MMFFSTADFDVTSILPETVRFGVLDISRIPSDAQSTQIVMKDINPDGVLDLVLWFSRQESGLTCDST